MPPPLPDSELTFYPRYLFAESPVFSSWARLTARDIHERLYIRPGYEGQSQEVWFFPGTNHPIRWVRVAGVVIGCTDWERRFMLTVDDGSGYLLDVIIVKDGFQAPSATELVAPIDTKGLEAGMVVKVKGFISEFRGRRQMNLRKFQVIHDTGEEVEGWMQMVVWRKEVLMKPWVVDEKVRKKVERQLRRQRLEERRQAEVEKRKRKGWDATDDEGREGKRRKSASAGEELGASDDRFRGKRRSKDFIPIPRILEDAEPKEQGDTRFTGRRRPSIPALESTSFMPEAPVGSADIYYSNVADPVERSESADWAMHAVRAQSEGISDSTFRGRRRPKDYVPVRPAVLKETSNELFAEESRFVNCMQRPSTAEQDARSDREPSVAISEDRFRGRRRPKDYRPPTPKRPSVSDRVTFEEANLQSYHVEEHELRRRNYSTDRGSEEILDGGFTGRRRQKGDTPSLPPSRASCRSTETTAPPKEADTCLRAGKGDDEESLKSGGQFREDGFHGRRRANGHISRPATMSPVTDRTGAVVLVPATVMKSKEHSKEGSMRRKSDPRHDSELRMFIQSPQPLATKVYVEQWFRSQASYDDLEFSNGNNKVNSLQQSIRGQSENLSSVTNNWELEAQKRTKQRQSVDRVEDSRSVKKPKNEEAIYGDDWIPTSAQPQSVAHQLNVEELEATIVRPHRPGHRRMRLVDESKLQPRPSDTTRRSTSTSGAVQHVETIASSVYHSRDETILMDVTNEQPTSPPKSSFRGHRRTASEKLDSRRQPDKKNERGLLASQADHHDGRSRTSKAGHAVEPAVRLPVPTRLHAGGVAQASRSNPVLAETSLLKNHQAEQHPSDFRGHRRIKPVQPIARAERAEKTTVLNARTLKKAILSYIRKKDPSFLSIPFLQSLSEINDHARTALQSSNPPTPPDVPSLLHQTLLSLAADGHLLKKDDEEWIVVGPAHLRGIIDGAVRSAKSKIGSQAVVLVRNVWMKVKKIGGVWQHVGKAAVEEVLERELAKVSVGGQWKGVKGGWAWVIE